MIIVEENGIKHIFMAYSQGAQKTDILGHFEFTGTWGMDNEYPPFYYLANVYFLNLE
jgi:hypothetical protein